MMVTCAHLQKQKFGKDRDGNQRYKCCLCGKRFTEERPKPLGNMSTSVSDAKLALRLLTEGMGVRATCRTTGLDKRTILKLVVLFGTACREFLDKRMRGLTLTHLQFDEQWTYVAKKQSRLTTTERAECHDIGDVYLWTCVDQQTKLMPSFRIGKRSADNARRFMMDIAGRLISPARRPAMPATFKPAGTKPSFKSARTASRLIPKPSTWRSAPTRNSVRSSSSIGTRR